MSHFLKIIFLKIFFEKSQLNNFFSQNLKKKNYFQKQFLKFGQLLPEGIKNKRPMELSKGMLCCNSCGKALILQLCKEAELAVELRNHQNIWTIIFQQKECFLKMKK